MKYKILKHIGLAGC